MYAVVKTGGKEYRVSKGDLIRVEKLEGKVGDPVELKDVLMVSKEGETLLGTPHLTQCRHQRGNRPGVEGEKGPDLQDEKEKELSAIQRTSPNLYVSEGKRHQLRLED